MIKIILKELVKRKYFDFVMYVLPYEGKIFRLYEKINLRVGGSMLVKHGAGTHIRKSIRYVTLYNPFFMSSYEKTGDECRYE